MRKLINIHLSFLLIFVLSCENSAPVPEDTFTQRSVKSLSAQEIPNVIAQLNKTLNYRDEIKTSSNSGINTASFGEIEMDNIIEVIDTLSNANYTFMVNDGDINPHTFSNLVIKKNASGAFDTPYLLEYEVDSTSMSEFIRSEFSMDNFTGRVYKRYLSNISYNGGNQANLENRSNTNSPGPCDLVTTYTNGNTGTGLTDSNDAPDSPAPTNEGGSSDDDGCFTYFEYFFVERICHRFKYDGQSPDRYCRNVFVRTEVTQCPGDFGPHTSIEDDCPSNLDDEIGIIISDAEMRDLVLLDLLESDSHALLDIHCDEIEKWRIIAEHKPDQSVVDKLTQLETQNTSGLFGVGYDIQTLAGAHGATVNMDYFSVTITELPNGLTADYFLEEIRRNINDFVDTDLSSFRPYDLTPTGTDENAIWNSSTPLGAVIHINIPGDNASVVCSDYSNQHWRFSTITSPGDYIHPVSGTREFGYERNPDGSYTFYTRGVDRVTLAMRDNTSGILSLGDLVMTKVAFNGADNLWKSIQNGVENYVNNNGGYAYKNTPLVHRPDYFTLEKVLNGELPLTALGCD